MKVSIVVPVYNGEATLAETLESVQAQSYKNWELIVVNDGSTDRSREIAQRFDCRILDVEHDGLGIGRVRNAGFSRATGDFFLPLDADDILDQDYLSKTLMLMTPGVGIVCTDIQYFGIQTNRISSWTNKFGETMTLEDEFEANNIPVCSLIRAEAFRQSGGYNDLLWGWEDWCLWLDILKRGWGIRCLHEPLFKYRTRNGSYAEAAYRRSAELSSLMREIHGSAFTGSR